MNLSVLTDEITQDFSRALQVCQELGIDTVELRQIEGKNIVYHDEPRLRQMRTQLKEQGLRVCAIASPFLKCQIWRDETGAVKQEREQWRLLQRSFELANFFEAPLVRTFSFLRVAEPEQMRDLVLDVVSEAVERTKAAGLKLVM